MQICLRGFKHKVRIGRHVCGGADQHSKGQAYRRNLSSQVCDLIGYDCLDPHPIFALRPHFPHAALADRLIPRTPRALPCYTDNGHVLLTHLVESLRCP